MVFEDHQVQAIRQIRLLRLRQLDPQHLVGDRRLAFQHHPLGRRRLTFAGLLRANRHDQQGQRRHGTSER